MSEPTSNPFASPQLENFPASDSNPLTPMSAGRWIGLSSLSGALLFAAYLVMCVALFLIGGIYISEEVAFWDTLQRSLTVIALYCLIVGAYGAVVGTAVGLGLGWFSFVLRDREPLSLLILVSVPASLLVTFIPLIFLLGGFDPRSAAGILGYWWMVAVLGSLLAGSHLVRNINRFLLHPHMAHQRTEP